MMLKDKIKLGVVVILLAVGLSACGVRGSLEAPKEAKADPTAPADSGQGKAEGTALKPHKPFVLDGLIR